MNNKIKTLILIIAITLVTLISSSYALLRNSSRGNNSYTMNAGNLEVNFLDNLTNGINLTNAYPMSDKEGMEQEDTLEFTIKNNGNMEALYDVYIYETSTNPEFKTVIRYASSKDNGVTYSSPKTLSENKYIEQNGIINVNEEVTYKVKIWLAESADNTYMNKTFSARIVVESLQNNNVVTFDANGGTVPISRKNVKYGESYGDLPIPTREGYTFDGWRILIDNDYELLEYIESTGTQYIDTGYYLNSNNIKIQTKIYTHGMPTSEQNFVSNQDNTTGRFVFGLFNQRVFAYSRDSDGIDTNAISETYTGEATLEIESEYNYSNKIKKLTVNGKFATETQNATIANSNKVIRLFGAASSNNYNFIGKLYYLKLFANNSLVKNYIPVRKISTDEIGLYDIISKEFYKNNGKGQFIAGPMKKTNSSIVAISTNHTLYANWIKDTIEVTFDANGGSVSTLTKQVVYNENYGELPIPTKNGYTFMGWNGANYYNYQDRNQITSGYTADDNGWITLNTSSGIQYYNYWTHNLNVLPSTNYLIVLETQNISNITGNLVVTSLGPGGQINDIFLNNYQINPNSIYLFKTSTTPEATYDYGIRTFYANENYNINESLTFRISVLDINNNITEENFQYEPYYIISNTKVVQKTDHTLKAIWKENS